MNRLSSGFVKPKRDVFAEEAKRDSDARDEWNQQPCEKDEQLAADIVKNVSNFILDDELYDVYDIHSEAIPEISNRVVKNEDIDLRSLRPPSPSVLPFDSQYLSDVWRPPSPDKALPKPFFSENGLKFNQQELLQDHKIEKPTPVRLEDLEADIVHKKDFSIADELAAEDEITFNVLPVGDSKDRAQSRNEPSKDSPKPSLPPPPGLEKKVPTPMEMNFPALGATNLPGMMMPSFLPEGVSLELLQSQFAIMQLEKSLFELNSMRNIPQDMSFMGPNGRFCGMMFNQQQQDLISKIIVPAQAANRSILQGSKNLNDAANNKNFMTSRDRDFLIRVFQLQTKRNDPYVDDYYEVNFKGKKVQDRNRRKLAQEMNLPMDDPKIDAIIESQPLFVLPDRAKNNDVERPRIIEFEGTLGKIQAANSRFPRKFLSKFEDEVVENNSFKLDNYRALLKRIEDGYEIFMNMEDEERRLPILPEEMKLQHRENQIIMCNELYQLLLDPARPKSTRRKTIEPNHFTLIARNMPTLPNLDSFIDPELLATSKGVNLAFRVLRHIEDEAQLTVLLCALFPWSIYEPFVVSQNRQLRDGGVMLNKALSRVYQTRHLIYIAAAMDNFQLFTNNEYAFKMLVTLLKQYESSNEKTTFLFFWKLFVNTIAERVQPISAEMHELCVKHLEYLVTL